MVKKGLAFVLEGGREEGGREGGREGGKCPYLQKWIEGGLLEEGREGGREDRVNVHYKEIFGEKRVFLCVLSFWGA